MVTKVRKDVGMAYGESLRVLIMDNSSSQVPKYIREDRYGKGSTTKGFCTL
ncbi:hypothetical protein [Vibrio phage vB_pir03]|nr:hypothetical protein [Vibrio phage vB_pir03]